MANQLIQKSLNKHLDLKLDRTDFYKYNVSKVDKKDLDQFQSSIHVIMSQLSNLTIALLEYVNSMFSNK